LARVQPAPKRQVTAEWVARAGWLKVHPGRVQAAPNRHGIVGVWCEGAWWVCGAGTATFGAGCSAEKKNVSMMKRETGH